MTEKPEISFDDFKKMDIRIGEIKSVEIVPDTDKLLKLQVDLGEGEYRQIISGIREYFVDYEELVGKSCPFVVNLEPRTIRGSLSNGMIMAASGNDGGFSLLITDTPLPSGSHVC